MTPSNTTGAQALSDFGRAWAETKGHERPGESAEAYAKGREDERAASREQAGAPDASKLVPGQMHCARCKFQLTRTNLYVNSGTVGAGRFEDGTVPERLRPAVASDMGAGRPRCMGHLRDDV